MTRTEAASKFSEAYKAYQIHKGAAHCIETATAYATSDVLNMTRNMSDEDAVYVILDEASIYLEAA